MTEKPTYEDLEKKIQELEQENSEYKQAELWKLLNIRILDRINRSGVMKDCIEEILTEIKQFTGFQAVAIRLNEGEDFPYYVTKGFPDHFVEAERYLCTRDSMNEIKRDSNGNPYVECMCGNIICGRTDDSKDFFTRGGSFCSNNTSKLLSETTGEDRQTRTRNRCNSEGYESVGLFPLKAGNEILGLLQLNDMRLHQFTEENIKFFEEIGLSIGSAFSKKRIEDALLESERKYRAVFDNAIEGILIAKAGKIAFANAALEKITGYNKEVLTSKSFTEFIHPDDREMVFERYRKRIAGEDVETGYEFRVVRPSGERIWVYILSSPIVWEGEPSTLNFLADISLKKRIEKQLHEAQKMESIGALAGGIAHDFNNLLYVVMGNISLAQDDLTLELATSENLREAEQACIMAKELAARLITFSKGGDPVKKMIPINGLIKDMVVSVLSGSNITPKISIADAVRNANIDEGQIKQVVRNIVVNAIEAMGDNGQLTVSCENVDIAEKGYLTLNQGEYIKISFKDQGCGISKENLKKIFDPYFSTKDMGADKGQGLGLTVSYSIIQKHGGLITVESEPGKGSTFSIYLPAFLVKEPDLKKSEEKPIVQKPVKQPANGTGKILLMDDEKAIRKFLGKVINRLGYDVETCIEGKEAVEIYTNAMESKEPFDVVILDLTNKIGMGGQETMKRLLEIDSDVKGLIITGYSNDPVVTNFRAYGFSGFIIKPATKDELSKVINEVLS